MFERLVLMGALLGAFGCTLPSADKCGSSCSGCCDINGACQAASSTSCGAAGSACTQCLGNQSCSLGLCLSPNASGGGTGGAGGGTATGGGGAATGGGGAATGGGGAATGGGGAATGGGGAATGGGASDGGPTACERVQPTRLGSTLYLAFDKSGSMVDPIVAGGPSKWTIATTALKQMTAQYETQLQFGLGLFPEGAATSTRCLAGPPAVSVGDRRAAAIGSALDATMPGGSTPIGGALTAAGAVPELVDPTRANYVMLVTDGTETCNGNGLQAAADNLALRGIKTFVVGFGDQVDAVNLTDLATAGGTALPGTPKYYQADDAPGLLAAVDRIARGALGCEYRLAPTPADPSTLFVYVNGVVQSRDAGWDYSVPTGRVSFAGGLCTLVATNATATVSVLSGCRDDALVARRDGGAGLPAGASCGGNPDCASNVCSAGTCG